jgi:hypothetical protein
MAEVDDQQILVHRAEKKKTETPRWLGIATLTCLRVFGEYQFSLFLSNSLLARATMPLAVPGHSCPKASSGPEGVERRRSRNPRRGNVICSRPVAKDPM